MSATDKRPPRTHGGFAESLFQGEPRWDAVFPFPEQDPADRSRADALLVRLEAFLKTSLDADRIDQEGLIPDETMRGLAELGCFGLNVPVEYGGLGLSQANCHRAIELIASHCGSTAGMLSVHQSLGTQALLSFGSGEQKKRYLPKLAGGRLAAFCLTEPEGAASQPSSLRTAAALSADASHYTLDGTKLFSTNSPIADVLIVLAKIPTAPDALTALILEKELKHFEVAHRVGFMGVRGLQSGLIRFSGVRVPVGNRLGAAGDGLRIALRLLTTGRIYTATICSGTSKRALAQVRDWSRSRVQWGTPIGRHDSIAAKLARMAANAYAIESATRLCISAAESGLTDLRLEAAMLKVFSSEAAWMNADDSIQIRGGRGYETAASQIARGEAPVPVERFMRDVRAVRIAEGTSEVLRYFLGREAVREHRRRLDLPPGAGALRRALSLTRGLLLFLCPSTRRRPKRIPGRLDAHLRFTSALSRKMARDLFKTLIFPSSSTAQDRKISLCADIATTLFIMTACCARAAAAGEADRAGHEKLADLFCREAAARIRSELSAGKQANAALLGPLASEILEGRYRWLESGIVTY